MSARGADTLAARALADVRVGWNVVNLQRELRTLIAEADRRGDQEMLTKLIAEKLMIDRKLRDG